MSSSKTSNPFAPAPEPATPLGRLRILSPMAGIRVSPLQLGAMSIGEAWTPFMGSMDKKKSFELLDAFVEAGGNFIDTANNYQNEESEKWLGEWMKERGNRDQMVIATKYTTDYRSWEAGNGKTPNSSGNHKRSLHMSVRDSLKKLQTDWIDILYLHWWDHTTSIEEVMDSLHILVQQGKVLYLGISDSPAWVVSAANTYAKAHGKTPFAIYQGRWNVMKRDFERDIIPMARHFGMALAPWDVLAAGKLTSRKALEAREATGEKLRSLTGLNTDEEIWMKTVDTLEEVGKELGTESVPAVAIAYVMAKTQYVFPILGGRKVENLKDNITALSLRLSPEQIKKIESVGNFDIGFPNEFIGEDPGETGKFSNMLLTSSATLDPIKNPRPVGY